MNKGFIERSELSRFCLPDSILGGHPERGKVPGVEASTGALGHGLSIGVGMALAAKIHKKSHRIVVSSQYSNPNYSLNLRQRAK